MAYPLIILGAGASMDLLEPDAYPALEANHLRKWRPPLANEIFDTRRFHSLLNNYPEASTLAASIKHKISSGESLEDCLSEVKSKIKSNPKREQQLASMLFYLADLFTQVSSAYNVSTGNYNGLIAKIDDFGGEALIVNFNYDLLLEKALGIDTSKIEKYVDGKIKIIKVHGACNWYYQRLINASNDKPCYHYAMIGAPYLFTPDPKTWKLVVKDEVKSSLALPLLDFDSDTASCFHPALALPLQEKDNYVCPQSHIEFLEANIEKIDRILIIGWRAADKYVIKLLEEKLSKKEIPIYIVCGPRSGEKIRANLGKISRNVVMINPKGFSDFLADDCDKFLNKELDSRIVTK